MKYARVLLVVFLLLYLHNNILHYIVPILGHAFWKT